MAAVEGDATFTVRFIFTKLNGKGFNFGFEVLSETTFTGCWHILKTVKNVTVAKFELAFTRVRHNLKTVRNLTVKKSLQDFDAKEMYLHPKN